MTVRALADGRACTGGFSLLELLVAITILVLCVTSIFGTLSATKGHYLRTDALITGRLLAQSILEQAKHRLHAGDPRFYKLDTSPSELYARTLRLEWRRPFEKLAHPKTPVITQPGPSTPYFDPTNGPWLPSGPDAADELAYWEGFSYEVRVGFDLVPQLGGLAVPIDSDGDGLGEIDVARIEVEVFFKAPDGSTPDRSVCKLTTLLTSLDKTPGTGVLSKL